MTVLPEKGLYAITQPENKSHVKVAEEVAAAIKGGAVIIQYRDKRPDVTEKLATLLLKICRSNKVQFIVNDNIELAATIGADGVHLGKDDGRLIEARKNLGKDTIIGVSCYNDFDLAQTAQVQGASYVAFGRFFPSASKPLAPLAEIKTLHKAKQLLHIPIVAIGGINPQNGKELVAAGADFLAAIDGVFADQPEQSARNYQRLFE